jgi:hypothetical protein
VGAVCATTDQLRAEKRWQFSGDSVPGTVHIKTPEDADEIVTVTTPQH